MKLITAEKNAPIEKDEKEQCHTFMGNLPSIFNNIFNSNTMDNALTFVLNTFNITKEHLFSKNQSREYADPRALLYAIMYNGNKYDLRKTIADRYNYTSSLSSIANGIEKANKYYQKEINKFKLLQRI
jgi:chromosomal replication initiation ATPase DnaA